MAKYKKPKPRQVFLFCSLKGGVGKSTMSTSFAVWLAKQGHRVAVIDMDITSPSVPNILGIGKSKLTIQKDGLFRPIKSKSWPNLVVMSVDFLLPKKNQPILVKERTKTSLIDQVLRACDYGKLDYMVVDSPPSTSSEGAKILSMFENKKLRIVFVTQPSATSINSVQKILRFAREKGHRISGIVDNFHGLYCEQCGHYNEIFKASKGNTQKLAERDRIPYLGKVAVNVKKSKGGEFIVDNKAFDEVAGHIFNDRPVKFKEKNLKANIYEKLKIAYRVEKM